MNFNKYTGIAAILIAAACTTEKISDRNGPSAGGSGGTVSDPPPQAGTGGTGGSEPLPPPPGGTGGTESPDSGPAPEPDCSNQFISYDEVFAALQADILSEVDLEDRPFIRYVTLTNRYNAGVCSQSLEQDRWAVTKLFNSLSSLSRITRPEAINREETIYRIDLRDYGLDSADWKKIVAKDQFAVTFVGDEANAVKDATGETIPVVLFNSFSDVTTSEALYYDLLNVGVDAVAAAAAKVVVDAQFAVADVAAAAVAEQNLIAALERVQVIAAGNVVVEDGLLALVAKAVVAAQATAVDVDNNVKSTASAVAGRAVLDEVVVLQAQVNLLAAGAFKDAAQLILDQATVVGRAAIAKLVLQDRLGIDLADDFERQVTVLAGTSTSAISQQERVAQRNDQALGGLYYWESFDLNPKVAGESAFANPIGFVDEAAESEALFSLPNGFQGYAIFGANGELFTESSILQDNVSQNDNVMRAGISCMACHPNGIFPFQDQVRQFALANPLVVAADFETVLDLYPDSDDLSDVFATDRRIYDSALSRANIPTQEADPVAEVYKRFDKDVTLTVLAGDLHFPEAQLRAEINRLDPALAGLDEGFRVDRDDVKGLYCDTLKVVLVAAENQPVCPLTVSE